VKTLSVLLLTIAIIVESALTTLPLVLLVLLAIMSLFKNNFVFTLAFIFGILLDLLTLKTVGATSMFFVCFMFLILLYQSKFEIATNTFIIVASFLGSFCFLVINANSSDLILESIVSTLLGLLIFMLIKHFFLPKQQND
jgi:cell shape-determining protein MreD